MTIVQIDEVAAHLNMGSAPAAELAKLNEHTAAAIEYVQSLVGPLDPEVTTTLVTYQVGRMLTLPASRLAAVNEVRDPQGAVVDVSPADIDLPAGIITTPWVAPGPWEVDVTPRPVPESVKLAVKIIAGHLWETQRGRGVPERAAAYAAGGEDITPRRGFAIPSRALELLAPHLTPGFA